MKSQNVALSRSMSGSAMPDSGHRNSRQRSSPGTLKSGSDQTAYDGQNASMTSSSRVSSRAIRFLLENMRQWSRIVARRRLKNMPTNVATLTYLSTRTSEAGISISPNRFPRQRRTCVPDGVGHRGYRTVRSGAQGRVLISAES